jgi:uncharacterized protein YkwD
MQIWGENLNNVGYRAARSIWTLGLLSFALGLQSGVFTPARSDAAESVRVQESHPLIQNWVSVASERLRLCSESEMRTHALHLVNRDRQARGLTPVVPDPVADRAAQAHAQDMLQRQFFDHSTPEGLKPRQRYLNHGGGSVQLIGENIFFIKNHALTGLTFDLAEHLQRGWMGSPGHREIILTRDFQGFGFGVAYATTGKLYAVQVFTTGSRLRRMR